jgi:predicted O-linked N-acetylglucosamine transferase (SPINDLY family)
VSDRLQSAWQLQQAGRLPEAARIYADIIRSEPRNFDAFNQLGVIYLQTGHFADADRLFTAAAQINSQSPELFYNKGCALQGLSRQNDALACFARALALKPDFVEARNNRGVTLLAMKRHKEALACFDRILETNPKLAIVHNNRATALLELEQPQEALAAANAALRETPNMAEALYSRGSALTRLGRHREALTQFDAAVAVDPSYADAFTHRGITLALLSRHEEALPNYNRALSLKPGDIEILYNRSTSLLALRRFEEAVPDCEQVLRGDPNFKYALGNLLYGRLSCCDWAGMTEQTAKAAAGLRAGLRALRPLQQVAISSSAADIRQCSRIWMRHEAPPSKEPVWRGERYDHDRIRVAYVSADFRRHPVGVLTAGLFEHHDKSRFETFAISLSGDDGSDIHKRARAAFDHFIDVKDQSDVEAAQLLHEMQIDIAIDMTGFTENSMTALFARRPAGLQVNYLGFPGTMGAPYIDYVLADRFIIPEEQQEFYDEKVVYLPHSYLPNDATRPIAERTPSRAEAGLPDDGFVFCSFNMVYKITPDIFDVWMRLLAQVEGSVLWLPESNPGAVANLRREAQARGVAADRVIFAPYVASPGEHLARLRLADVFLDTLPYNAHATACDALWAGVPMITLLGSSFAGRVGAGLLAGVGLPELITRSRQEYEALALQLARDADALRALRDKLARHRVTEPLFDTARFTRNLESAYLTMWRRHQDGEPPATFAVADTANP